ncbi:MAG: BolA family transcriptional regulator [bacterium]|nr:BolA family transcriptional regulator [bacterium]
MTDLPRGPVAAELVRRLESELEPTRLELRNDSDQHAGHAGHDGSGESHFAVTIASGAFEGLNRVQRQRLVFRAVGDLMDRKVHALQIRAILPGED